MGTELILASVAVGLGVVSTYMQVKAQKAQKRIQKLEQRKEAVQNVREARIKRAQIEASAEAKGVQGSSGALGGAGSVSSQLASNLSFLDEVGTLQNKVAKANTLGTIFSQGSQLAAFGLEQKLTAERIREQTGNPNAKTGTIFDIKIF